LCRFTVQLHLLDDERQPVDHNDADALSRRPAAHAPALAVQAKPAVGVHLTDAADERFHADGRAAAVRPAPPEPRLAELDRTAAGDCQPAPRLVEDEDREQDCDDEER
jgi:hypothetical protein